MSRLFARVLFIPFLMAGALPVFAGKADSPFDDCVRITGNSGVVIIPAGSGPLVDGAALKAGDEIAAYTEDGICAGRALWTGANLAFTIWGNNSQTKEKDGFADGERILFRIFSQEQGEAIHHVAVTYDGSQFYLSDDGTYGEGMIYMVNSMDGSLHGEEVVVPAAVAVGRPYPNPFIPGLHNEVQIGVDTEEEELSVEVFDLLGRRLAHGRVAADGAETAYSWAGVDERGQAVAPGRYFVRFTTAGGASAVRIVVVGR
jgi:hypothetical protein